jgi:hypothetical protein
MSAMGHVVVIDLAVIQDVMALMPVNMMKDFSFYIQHVHQNIVFIGEIKLNTIEFILSLDVVIMGVVVGTKYQMNVVSDVLIVLILPI